MTVTTMMTRSALTDALVDEVGGTVARRCPRCDRGAATRADKRLVAACEASLMAVGRPARRDAA